MIEFQAYGYTDAFLGDYSELVYLRARMYAPGMGRFLTRDTWGGDANQPGSFNRWNYTESNPVNFVDPSGFKPHSPNANDCSYEYPRLNAGIVEANVNLSKSDWLNTYAVAGLAVQCWAEKLDWRPFNDTWGPAQVSDNQTMTPYGSGDALGSLRCYLNIPLRDDWFVSKANCECFTPKERNNIPNFDKKYRLEPELNQDDWENAVILMRRRIKHAIDTCEKCRDTDKYIIAAMAQNGPAFPVMDKSILPLPENKRTPGSFYNWVPYYQDSRDKGNKINTTDQLWRFTDAFKEFRARGWAIPSFIEMGPIVTLTAMN